MAWIDPVIVALLACTVQAAEAPPGADEELNHKGQRHWQAGQQDLALTAFQDALDRRYNDQYLWNLARAFESTGRPERALAIYELLTETAGDLDPHFRAKLPDARVRARAARASPGTSQAFHPPALSCPDGMVAVPSAAVWVGSSSTRLAAERPERVVFVSAFCIDRHEVSNAAWTGCVDAGHCARSAHALDTRLNGPLQPVVGISWTDATQFCEAAGKRLPWEAEWEAAARGARKDLQPGLTPGTANLAGAGDGFEQTAPVGSFPTDRAECGALDLLGNAAEWCGGWFDPAGWAAASRRDPKGPPTGRQRVARGAAWNTRVDAASVVTRQALAPDARALNTVSFRCVTEATRKSP